ncbi:zinc finger MYM-type protein 1-like [Sipha flava]|uniref:Zinc finger MYM-type protein 1-like n=1 Tax=Sipha flava TaxID=143950 RepID=A0A8B8GF98_9HEMI|nr:zinc finger MYM-type protein 1-like [Sipha flava]
MSSQRSDCENRKRKAHKEAKLVKIKSQCSIKNYFSLNILHFQDSSSANTTGSISDESKKSEYKNVHNDDSSPANIIISLSDESKKSEYKNVHIDDVNMVNVYDPVTPLPKDRLEFQNRILKGRYKPILDLYPRSTQNSKRRSFQKNWYDIFDWLEYSDASDTAFCFPCRCFKGNEINSCYSDTTFSKKGFKSWYRAIDAFKKHQLSKCHLNSVKALNDFIHLKSIDCVLDKNRLKEISRKEKDRLKNREFMKRVIDIIICLGKSGRPFRGHDEKSDSCNQGLFKELVILLTKYDIVLQNHFQDVQKNALYTSNRIQNDLITSIKNVILQNIKNSLKNSFISILADETTDVGHSEQLSIVFRYFDDEKNRPVETYIALKQMKSVTAQAIFDVLHEVLILMGKDWHSVLSVCFDGASAMAGKIGGVQTKCKEKNSSIKYVHCYAHCLNLALVDSVCDKSKNFKRNRLVFNFFGTIQFIYNFIESSAMRHAILEKISKDVGIKLITLKSCSITHWACRAEAVKSVLNNYEVLLLAIEDICESSSVPEMCAKGMGLKYQLKNFDFIFGLYLLNPILNLILKTSSILQSPNMDLVLAINSVQSLVQNLEAMRNNDEDFKNIYQQSVELCNKNGVQVPEVVNRKVSTRIDKMSNSQFFFKTKYDELKITVYNHLLDELISGINTRFNQETVELVQSVAGMIRLESTPEMISILSKFANVPEEILVSEIKLLKYLPVTDGKPNTLNSNTNNESIHE